MRIVIKQALARKRHGNAGFSNNDASNAST